MHFSKNPDYRTFTLEFFTGNAGVVDGGLHLVKCCEGALFIYFIFFNRKNLDIRPRTAENSEKDFLILAKEPLEVRDNPGGSCPKP